MSATPSPATPEADSPSGPQTHPQSAYQAPGCATSFFALITGGFTGLLGWMVCVFLFLGDASTSQGGLYVLAGVMLVGMPFPVIGAAWGAIQGIHMVRRNATFRTLAGAFGTLVGLTAGVVLNLLVCST